MRNRFLLKVFAIACLMALVTPLFLTTSAAEPDRYGYSLLANENQRVAYTALAAGIGECKSSISFQMNHVTQETLNDVMTALDMIAKDYPEYFWFSGGGAAESVNDTVTVTPTQYSIGGVPVSAGSAELTNAKTAFDSAVNTALAQIPAGASNYQKTQILHDYLAGKVTYLANEDDQTAYGALVLGKAVCAGYTRAYQYLLYRAGIRSWYVSGESYSPEGQLVNHAWNLVWLDGSCYYTDVTWDDQGDRLFHHYLNLSLEQMQQGHFSTDPLPAPCGHTQYTYFKMNSAPGKGICDMTGSETGGNIAKYFTLKSLTGDQAVYTCELHFHGADFGQWINAQIQGLVQELGLTGNIQYSYVSLGLEYQVTVTGTKKADAVIPETSTPSGGAQVPAQTDPPVNTQPPQQVTTPSTQPTEQTQPTTQPATQESTQPSATTEPPTSLPTDSTSPTSVPEPTEKTESDNKPASYVIPVVAIVILLAAGAVTVILVKRKR